MGEPPARFYQEMARLTGPARSASGHLVIWLSGYLVIWLSGDLVIWLFGYPVIWLFMWLAGHSIDQSSFNRSIND
jgi:hypothetical protein